MSFKELNISNPGTSIKFGSNDLDKITKLLNGVTSGIPPVTIKSTAKFGFLDGLLWIFNQAASRKITLRGPANVPATDVDLTLPPITTNDVLAAIGTQNIFSIKQQFNAGLLHQEMAEPAAPTTTQHILYVDSTTKHLVKKNSAGQKVDYDVYVGGGEANTVSNLGAGIGLYKTKVGSDLQFKSINTGSSTISITNDVANNEVDIDIPNAGITYAKIQNIAATSRILGRITAGAGVIEELTGTQLTTLLNVFTSALKGLVPLSGGGTSNYLRADGAWASPAGAGGAASTATYVTLTTDASLSAERTLAVGDGLALVDGGAGNPITIVNDTLDTGRRRVQFVDDFFGDSSTGGVNFQRSTTGTGADITNLGVSETGIFGAWQLTTGTTTTGRAAIMSGNSKSFSLGQGQASFEAFVKIPTLSTAVEEFIIRIGFQDNNAGGSSNGVYMIYDRLTSLNWKLNTSSAGTPTVVASTTAVTGSWVRLKIVVNAAGTSVAFFVNGTQVSGSPITTNIPTGSGKECTVVASIIKSAGGTARTFNMDYIAFEYDLSTPR